MSVPSGIAKLLAEQEIKDSVCRYARGVDRLDAREYKAAFRAGGGYRGEKPMREIADELLSVQLKGLFSVTQHLTGNILIDFIDAKTARTEVYFYAFHITRPNLGKEVVENLIGAQRLKQLGGDFNQPFELVIGGRYLDRCCLEDGAWRISDRRQIFDWVTVRENAALQHDQGLMGSCRVENTSVGKRDTTDASYLE